MPLPSYPYPHSAPTLDVPAPQSGQLGVQLQHLNQQAPLVAAQTEHLQAQTQSIQSSRATREEFKKKVGFYPEEMKVIMETADGIEKNSGKEAAVKWLNGITKGSGMSFTVDPTTNHLWHIGADGTVTDVDKVAGTVTQTPGHVKPDQNVSPYEDYRGSDPAKVEKAKEWQQLTQKPETTAKFSARDQVYLDAALSGKNKALVQSGKQPVTDLAPDEKVAVMDKIQRVEEKNKLDAARTMFYNLYPGIMETTRGLQQVADPATGLTKIVTGKEAIASGATPAKISDIQKVQQQKASMADVNYNMKEVYDHAAALVKNPNLVSAALASIDDQASFKEWVQGKLATGELTPEQFNGIKAIQRLREALLSLRSVLGSANAGSDVRFQALVAQLPGIQEIATGDPAKVQAAITGFQHQLNSVWEQYNPTSKLTPTTIPAGAPTTAPAPTTGGGWTPEKEKRLQELKAMTGGAP